MIMARAFLTIMNLRTIIEHASRGEIGIPTFQRPINRNIVKKLDFINDFAESGMFGLIRLQDNRSLEATMPNQSLPRYWIIDGMHRLDAMLMALTDTGLDGMPSTLAYDASKGMFVQDNGTSPNPSLIRASRIMGLGYNAALHQVSSLPAGNHASAVKLVSLFDMNIPVYTCQPEWTGFAGMWEGLNSTGLSIPSRLICPNGNPACRCRNNKAKPLEADSLMIEPGVAWAGKGKNPSNTAPCRDERARTCYEDVLGLPDVLSRISFVAPILVDTLAIDHNELLSYLLAIRKRAELILRSQTSIQPGRTYVETASKELIEHGGKLRGADGLYDSAELKAIRGIIAELLPTLDHLGKSMANPLEPINRMSLDHSGVFIDRRQRVGPYMCEAGIFIKEGLAEAENQATILHELAHAYMRANKQVIVDCRWIEEGLAEWLSYGYSSGYLAGSFPKASPHMYYDFLDYLTALPTDEVKQLADRWLRGSSSPKYWCALVTKFYGHRHGTAGHP
jgi:hypothetical protein